MLSLKRKEGSGKAWGLSWKKGVIHESGSTRGSYSRSNGRISSVKSTTTTPWMTPMGTPEPSGPSSINGNSSLFTAPTIVSPADSDGGAYAWGPTDKSGSANKSPPFRIATGTAKHSEKESSEITSSGIDNTKRDGSPVLHSFKLALMASIGREEGPQYLHHCKNTEPR